MDMLIDSRITWEKLGLELDLLNTEEPTSLIPLLMATNSIMSPNESLENCVRIVSFLTYELVSQCDELTPDKRFEHLTYFYFQLKGFKPFSGSTPSLLLKPVLTKRHGHPLPLALLYMHLARQIDLTIQLLHVKDLYIFKWVNGGHAHYFDFTSGCKSLCEADLVKLLNTGAELHSTNSGDRLARMTSYSLKTLFVHYIETLMTYLQSEGRLHQLHITLNILMRLDSSNLYILGQRALLRQKLGYAKEALHDLKRYFSFVDRDVAPLEIQLAFQQLESLGDLNPPSATDILH